MKKRLSRFDSGLWTASLPFLSFAFALTVLVGLLWIYTSAEQDRQALEVRVTAEQVRLRLEAWIGTRIATVEHMASQLDASRYPEEAVFRESARDFIDLFAGFQALNWIDRSWRIQIVVPELTNEPALGADLHDHFDVGVVAALSRATLEPGVVATQVIDLLQGGRGFATYRRVLGPDGRPIGYVNGVFRIDALVDACLRESGLRSRFTFELQDETGELAYFHNASDRAARRKDMVTVPVMIAGSRWTLSMAAAQDAITTATGRAVGWMVAAGIALAAFLAVAARGIFIRQQALIDRESKYRLLVENQTDLVVRFDTAGRFLFVSPSYCRMFGLSEEKLLGHSFMPLVHEEDRESTEAAMQGLYESPHTAYLEHRAMTRDGWKWFAWADTAVLGAGGEVEAIIGVGRDITRQKGLEEQLRRSHKMQVIGQLAGGIAHDFNNILQTILGFLDFALEAAPKGSQLREDLLRVEHSAQRANALTRQLLTFSRQRVVRKRAFDLNASVTGTFTMLRRVIPEAINFTFDPNRGPAVVRGDEPQIEQAVVNLVTNARDALQGGGRLTMSTRPVVLDEERCSAFPTARPGSFISLIVADDGVGMDAETLAHAFDPFFTTKEPGKGTGLGLVSVYGIVERHGGVIEIDSAPERGTTVSLYLPLVEEVADAPAAQPEQDQSPRGTETILVAEDDPHVQLLVERALRTAGYRVRTATDGNQAEALFNADTAEISLVVSDVVMPGMSGLELRRKLLAKRPDLKVLFMTGYSGREVDPLLDHGQAVDILFKPFDQRDFLARVREILDRRPDES